MTTPDQGRQQEAVDIQPRHDVYGSKCSAITTTVLQTAMGCAEYELRPSKEDPRARRIGR